MRASSDSCTNALRLPDEVSQRLTRLADLTGRSKTFYMIEAIKEHLDKLDRQAARRILAFLQGRVAPLEDPRSIGEALKGSRLGDDNARLWRGSPGRGGAPTWR